MSPASNAAAGAGNSVPIGLRIAAGAPERDRIEPDEAAEGVTDRSGRRLRRRRVIDRRGVMVVIDPMMRPARIHDVMRGRRAPFANVITGPCTRLMKSEHHGDRRAEQASPGVCA